MHKLKVYRITITQATVLAGLSIGASLASGLITGTYAAASLQNQVKNNTDDIATIKQALIELNKMPIRLASVEQKIDSTSDNTKEILNYLLRRGK